MPVISFGNTRNEVWGGAGWAFRQALKDLTPYAEGNEAFLQALEEAGHIGYLGVDDLEPHLRRTVIAALKDMCNGILDRSGPSSIDRSLPGDHVAQDRYVVAVRELLAMANAALSDVARE